MKKWLFIEVIILAALLIFAVVVLGRIGEPAMSPSLETNATESTTQPMTEETTQETTQATVPEGWIAPEGREILAKQYFVYDILSGSFVTLSGSDTDKVYPASITKLFTAYVALQFLQPEQEITAGNVLDLVGAGSSVANIKKGDVLTVEQLVAAMLLPSGNDAAYMLAAEAGKEIKEDATLSASAAVNAFVAEMNGQTRALGMSGTHFTNPDGYHSSNHYSSIKDMATIGMLSLKNDTIRKYAAVSRMDAPNYQGVGQFADGEEDPLAIWKNTNALIDPESVYYHPGAAGLKTGQTPSAGSCLLSAFDDRYIIGVFGCPEVKDRFEDTLQLYQEATK